MLDTICLLLITSFVVASSVYDIHSTYKQNKLNEEIRESNKELQKGVEILKNITVSIDGKNIVNTLTKAFNDVYKKIILILNYKA